MSKQVRFLKMTFTIDVEVGDGCWEASSKSLKLVAKGETPEGAVEALRMMIQEAENVAASPSSGGSGGGGSSPSLGNQIEDKLVGKLDEQEREETKESGLEETEQEPESEDSSSGGDGSGSEEESRAGLLERVGSAKIEELREISRVLGVDSTGKKKVELREELLEKLNGE